MLFSSHQLDVVERLCDDLVIIAGGTIRAAGSRDALRAEHSTRRFELVSAGDAGWLRAEPGVEVLDFDGGYAVFDVDGDETAQRVLRRAVAQGDVASFAPQHPTLAQIFKEVIQMSTDSHRHLHSAPSARRARASGSSPSARSARSCAARRS